MNTANSNTAITKSSSKWRYLVELSKNAFFDEFKIFDAIAHKEEFKNLGAMGEQYTYRALWYYFQDNLFRNVYTRKENGYYAEIDFVAVGKKGVFVFESKNWDGHICIDGSKTKCLVDYEGKRSTPENPVKQNAKHIEALKCSIGDIIPEDRFFSMVLYSARCKLDVENLPENTIVIKRDRLYNNELDQELRRISDNHAEVLTESEVIRLCNFLRASQRPDAKIRQEHLRSLGK